MAKKRIKNELSIVFGKEPSFDGVAVTDDNYNSLMTSALHWYGQYGGADNSNSLRNYHKSWLREWAKNNGIKRGSYTIPNQGISSLGSLARISLRGFPVKEKHISLLKNAFSEWKPVKPKKVDKEKLARQAKLRAQNAHNEAVKPALTVFDNAIDEIVDGAKKWSVKFEGELTVTQAKDLADYYKGCIAEFEEVKAGKDEQLNDAYTYSKLVLNRLIKAHNQILEQIEEASNRGKVIRKAKAVRRKKNKPASSMVRKLKYMTVHNGYNLASIDPEKLVGAQIAWVFDTKKRLLKKYVAGASGIEVSGMSLKNCVGVQKKIRKPEDMAQFANLPRTKADKEFESIKAVEKECTGRMNVDTIILRVF